MSKLTTDQIDDYHSGRMSESEMTNFEKSLESDPAIKAESDLQSDIVNGLKEYRKIELKSRLDAINVGPTWFEFAQQSTLLKSFGGVFIASLIGTGIYLYGEKVEIQSAEEGATVQAPTTESIEFVWSLSNDEETSDTRALEKPSQIVDKSAKNRTSESTASKTTAETSEPIDVLTDVKKEDAFKPSFEAPNAELVADEAEFATVGLDEIPSTSDSEVSEEPIDVQSEISKSSKIKYKYYDGKLFLNGDFDKAPYEILEINSTSGRRIYVYYLGKYYRVGIADKLTELPMVSNSKVIDELKLLRDNK